MFISEDGTKNYIIVYWGPALCGKSTSIRYIYDNTPENLRTQIISVATETDRTLYCSVKENMSRFYLYTIPGAVWYVESRRNLLENADGVIFVVDSQEQRLDSNLESYWMLQEFIKYHNRQIEQIPLVFCLNKQDLPRTIPQGMSVDDLKWYSYIMKSEDLIRELKIEDFPVFETVASAGVGVFEAFQKVKQLILEKKTS